MAEFGWSYRGDAGDEGGHVLVLESSPEVRVAHAHGVVKNSDQWRRYLALRELLRSSGEARSRYGERKLELLNTLSGDNLRPQYTEGKTTVVHALLADADQAP